MLNDNKGNAIKKEYVNKDSAKEKIIRLYTANKNSALALALSNTLKINTKNYAQTTKNTETLPFGHY